MPSTDYDEISSLLDVVFDESEKLTGYIEAFDEPTAADVAFDMRSQIVGWHDQSTAILALLRHAPEGPEKDRYGTQAIAHFQSMRSFVREMRMLALLMLSRSGSTPTES